MNPKFRALHCFLGALGFAALGFVFIYLTEPSGCRSAPACFLEGRSSMNGQLWGDFIIAAFLLLYSIVLAIMDLRKVRRRLVATSKPPPRK